VGAVLAQTAEVSSQKVFERARTHQGFAISGSCSVPTSISSKVTLAPPGERGQRPRPRGVRPAGRDEQRGPQREEDDHGGGKAAFGRPWLSPVVGVQNLFDRHYVVSLLAIRHEFARTVTAVAFDVS